MVTEHCEVTPIIIKMMIMGESLFVSFPLSYLRYKKVLGRVFL